MRLAKGYLAGSISQANGAEAAGATLASFQQWIMKYESEGIAAFCRRGKNKQYSEEMMKHAISIGFIVQGNNSVDKNVQKALHQIGGNPGGVIVDCPKSRLS